MQRFHGVLFCVLFLCAAFLADAAEPQTGTIEVEVVYKDTGEPVGPVVVALDRHREREPEDTFLCLLHGEPAGPDGQHTFDDLEYGTHDVLIGNALRGDGVRASQFYYGGSNTEMTVTLSQENPTADVVFEVVRGVRLYGTVTRRDGSPLAHAGVVVDQGEERLVDAYAVADQDGRFELLGVAAGPVARVHVLSSIESGELGFLPLYEQDVELGGEAAQADFVVATVPLDVTLDVVKPAWPFSSWREDREDFCLIWVGGKPENEPKRCDIQVPLAFLPFEKVPGMPRERYTLRLNDVPESGTITVGLATAFYGQTRRHGRYSPVEIRYHCWKTVQMAGAPRAVTLGMYEQYARLSRALWYGVPSLIVMAVLLTILVQGARKRRAKREEG